MNDLLSCLSRTCRSAQSPDAVSADHSVRPSLYPRRRRRSPSVARPPVRPSAGPPVCLSARPSTRPPARPPPRFARQPYRSPARCLYEQAEITASITQFNQPNGFRRVHTGLSGDRLGSVFLPAVRSRPDWPCPHRRALPRLARPGHTRSRASPAVRPVNGRLTVHGRRICTGFESWASRLSLVLSYICKDSRQSLDGRDLLTFAGRSINNSTLSSGFAELTVLNPSSPRPPPPKAQQKKTNKEKTGIKQQNMFFLSLSFFLCGGDCAVQIVHTRVGWYA